MEPKLLAISGVKNSGKTTLIERLLPILAARGLQVAVIKHDGHSFVPDAPGSDSYRFFAAGAQAAAVFDGEKYSLSVRGTTSAQELTAILPPVDLVLLEGFKNTAIPKLELLPQKKDAAPLCRGEDCLAYVSDLPLAADRPLFRRDELEKLANFILTYCARQQ